jgi:hypothetical protein
MVGLVDIGLSHNKKNQQTSQQRTHNKSPCLDPKFMFMRKANESNFKM